jgi:hypothetical protein
VLTFSSYDTTFKHTFPTASITKPPGGSMALTINGSIKLTTRRRLARRATLGRSHTGEAAEGSEQCKIKRLTCVSRS